MFKLFPIALIGAVAAAQTQIDLRTQARNVDFSAAASTKPLKTGTELPATCVAGEMFFKTDAAAGANLYGCTGTNSWAVEGGLSGENCWNDAVSQTLRCRDTNGNVYAVVKTSAGRVLNEWVDYIDSNGVPHTSQPTPAAVGATADPGSNGVPYRSGTGTATPATADNLSGSFFCQDTGGSSAYSCNLTPPVTSYSPGTTFWFRANTGNTGAATLNFNSLGPRTIVKQADQSLAAGDIKAGQWVMVIYDGANMQMQSQTANAAGSGASTVFGRSGSVSAQTGDYTSAQVTESGNLYFTGARARAAFSGSGPVTLNGATGAIDCPTCLSAGTSADTDLYGNFPHLSVIRIQGRPVASLPPGDMQYLGWNNAAGQWEPKTVPSALLSSVFGRTGAVLPASGDYTTAQVTESGNLYFTNARAWAALSGAGPIAFNSSTGAFNCPTCITSSTPADTDVGGTFPHLGVVRIQGRPVAATPPADQQYLGWNISANNWEPKTVPSALVPSVFGRAGPIAAQAGDYSFSQISGTAAASQLPAVALRTDQSNTVSAGTQDLSRAAHTLPLKSGLAAALPSSCTAAELYFATDAPAGSNVYGCTAANTWAVQGNLTVMSDGFAVGNSGTVDYITGTGLMTVIAATRSQINVQTALDTAVVQTQPGEQGGAALLCASGSGSGSAYTCSLNPTLGSYTQGMVLHWIPDLSASGGVTTLNVDTLGPQPVKLPDGVSNPANTDLLAGRLYNIWYDGAAFRLPATASTGGGGGGAVSSVFGRAGSVTAQSGDYTTAQVTESGSLYFTNARAQNAMSGLYQSPITGAPSAWPSFATVATSGSYSDLSNKPTLGTAASQASNYFQTAISGAPGTWPSFGGAALLSVGTIAGTVAAGNDSRFSGNSTAPYSCPVSSASSIVCTHHLGTSDPAVFCYDDSGNMLGGSGASSAVTSVLANSSSVVTITFSSNTTGTCLISTGGMGPAGATGATGAQGAAGGVPPTGANGVVVCTGSNCSTATTRSIATANSSHVTVSNGDATSGNPTLDLAAAATLHSIGFSAGDRNSSSALASGSIGTPVVMPFNCAITGWDASTADGTSVSASVDIWRQASTIPASSSYSICGGGTCPNLTTQRLVVNNTALTNWTSCCSADDVLVGVLTGTPTAKSVAIILRCTI